MARPRSPAPELRHLGAEGRRGLPVRPEPWLEDGVPRPVLTLGRGVDEETRTSLSLVLADPSLARLTPPWLCHPPTSPHGPRERTDMASTATVSAQAGEPRPGAAAGTWHRRTGCLGASLVGRIAGAAFTSAYFGQDASGCRSRNGLAVRPRASACSPGSLMRRSPWLTSRGKTARWVVRDEPLERGCDAVGE